MRCVKSQVEGKLQITGLVTKVPFSTCNSSKESPNETARRVLLGDLQCYNLESTMTLQESRFEDAGMKQNDALPATTEAALVQPASPSS